MRGRFGGSEKSKGLGPAAVDVAECVAGSSDEGAVNFGGVGGEVERGVGAGGAEEGEGAGVVQDAVGGGGWVEDATLEGSVAVVFVVRTE